ncbi:MAG: YbhB/YbcL family Raf kinase inhibitor-like protein [Terriglobales bacterium]
MESGVPAISLFSPPVLTRQITPRFRREPCRSTVNRFLPALNSQNGKHATARTHPPQLAWSGAPPGTKSFALILDDPDAPGGTFTHWMVWNIPAGTHELPENLPKTAELTDGARQGRNDFGKVGYGGPCPPPGKPHRYFFRLFALDNAPAVKAGAGREELERALQGHILARGELMGRYAR